MNTNEQILSVRALAPDLCAILEATGPIEPDADPVVSAYLDAHVPGWREPSRWMRLECAACGAQLTRPARRWEGEVCQGDEKGMAPVGWFVSQADAPPVVLSWNRNQPAPWYFHAHDTLWLETDDCGCCGNAGTPDNTRCRCGAVVGTVHTDCCGPWWFAPRAEATRARWGVPPMSAPERALADRLLALADEPEAARALLRTLAPPLPPALDVLAFEVAGRWRHFVYESWDKNARACWYAQWEEEGVALGWDGRGGLKSVERHLHGLPDGQWLRRDQGQWHEILHTERGPMIQPLSQEAVAQRLASLGLGVTGQASWAAAGR